MRMLTRHWSLLILGVIFALYCLFQARYLILGPSVSVTSHQDGEVVYSPKLTLEGKARNAAWLSLNDRPIYTDAEGHWSEKLLLAEGLSIMTLRVRDRFGRESIESVRLILN